MNRKELVAAIADRCEMSKGNVDKVVKAFTEIITEEMVKRESVQIVGFGTFEAVKKEARTGRNPATGEEIQIPGYHTPKFKPGKTLKDSVR